MHFSIKPTFPNTPTDVLPPEEDFFSPFFQGGNGLEWVFKAWPNNNPQGINQWTGLPKKTPEAALHAAKLAGLGEVEVQSGPKSHSYVAHGKFGSWKAVNSSAVQAQIGLNQKGFKRKFTSNLNGWKTVHYVDDKGKTATIQRRVNPTNGEIELRVEVHHTKPLENRQPSVTDKLKGVMGGGAQVTEKGLKTYLKDYEAQKAVHLAVHKALKAQGYNAGPVSTDSSKSYLKSTKYTKAGEPDVFVKAHKPDMAAKKGGKVEVIVPGQSTGKSASTTQSPYSAKPAATSVPPAAAPKPEPVPLGTHEKLSAHASNQISKLMATEKSSIKGYTGNGYSTMNKILRGKWHGPLGYADEFQPRIKRMANGLAKCTVGVEITLWRGVGGNTGRTLNEQAKAGKLQIGTTFSDKGFCSTSTREGVGKNWAGDCVLKIRAKPNTAGLYVRQISQHPSEEEVILPPNTKFVVMSVEKYPNSTKMVVEVEPLWP